MKAKPRRFPRDCPRLLPLILFASAALIFQYEERILPLRAGHVIELHTGQEGTDFCVQVTLGADAAMYLHRLNAHEFDVYGKHISMAEKSAPGKSETTAP